MEKIGQKRSLTRNIIRNLNPVHHFKYYGFGEYKEIYDKVNEIDQEMRDKALSYNTNIRDMIHEARMGFKNREYPKVMYYAWQLSSVVEDIFSKVSDLENLREKILQQYYGQKTDLTDEQLQQMHQSLIGNKKQSSFVNIDKLINSSTVPSLISQAGAGQWLKENIPSWKQMRGDIVEKLFYNKVNKQKEAARQALKLAEFLYSAVKQAFSALDRERNNFSRYIQIANMYVKNFDNIKQQLSSLYQGNFADIVPEMANYNDQSSNPSTESQDPVVEVEEAQKSANNTISSLIKKAIYLEKTNPEKAIILFIKASEMCDHEKDKNASIILLNKVHRMLTNNE